MRPTHATRTSRNGKAPLNVKLDELIREMIDSGIRFPEARREFEKRFLARIMERERGNLSRAAKVLRIHRNTLSKKLAELNAAPR